MKVLRIGLFTLVLLTVSSALALAEFYQYVDRNGNIVYTDKPPQNAESRQKSPREGGVYWSAPAGRDLLSDKPGIPEEPKKNYNRVNVVMYMTDW